MGQLIRVEMTDGSICRMAQKAFEMFLTYKKIIRFERSDGWVTVGEGLLRGMVDSSEYTGPERRFVLQSKG